MKRSSRKSGARVRNSSPTMRIAVLLGFVVLSLITESCATTAGGLAPSKVSWREKLFAWPQEIDYASPEDYLAAGALTSLSSENIARLNAVIAPDARDRKGWDAVAGIYAFMMDRSNFTPSAAGGAFIAKRTVDQMLAERTLTGCHDWGIVLAASLRAIGIPAVFVDTASVPWARAYAAGKRDMGFQGHIFVEAWIDGRWVILNSTAPFAVADYQPADPLLGFTVGSSDRYFVMFKGLDPLDYGITGVADMNAALAQAADRIVREAAALPEPPRPQAIAVYRTGAP